MLTYAHYGVGHLWLLDPLARTLESFVLNEGKWVVGGVFKDDDKVSTAPFAEIAVDLSELWTDIVAE